MATFSQRIGKKPMFKPLQIEDLDDDLRNTLWNCFYLAYCKEAISYFQGIRTIQLREYEEIRALFEQIWMGHLRQGLDSRPVFYLGETPPSEVNVVRAVFKHGAFHEVYDLIEFVISSSRGHRKDTFIEAVNSTFAQENAAYRVVGDQVTPITSQHERDSVSSVLEIASNAISEHLSSALRFLSDRKAPDYRNSIKESISAVEAACKLISKKPSAALGEALNEIGKRKPMNQALYGALQKLYGYTNDPVYGIRHALIDTAEPCSKADAQFMLVSCSAFVNYLWTLAAETGISVSD